jgi:transposase-like protein
MATTETAMEAALRAAKEKRAHFLLSKAAQDFKPKDAVAVKKDEAYERFKEIRFGWTGGAVECPHCGGSAPYELKNRLMWRCKKCVTQFSVTSGTIFQSRKASFQTILHAVSLRLHDPQNILQTSYLLGVQYRTAYAWASKFRLFLGNAPKQTRVQDNRWPYLNGDRDEAQKLIATINGLLPRELPEQKRADVAQEMILGVLSGEITEADLKAKALLYIRKYHKNYENHFRDTSFDQMRGDGDGYNLHDIISEESATDAWNRFI